MLLLLLLLWQQQKSVAMVAGAAAAECLSQSWSGSAIPSTYAWPQLVTNQRRRGCRSTMSSSCFKGVLFAKYVVELNTQHLAHYRLQLEAKCERKRFSDLGLPRRQDNIACCLIGQLVQPSSRSKGGSRKQEGRQARNCSVLKYALMKLSCPTASQIYGVANSSQFPFQILLPAATLNKSISRALWSSRGWPIGLRLV